MLSSAIVVFREVFEIVLIVGIVMAATKGMPNRARAILMGFAGGITGSAVIAVFTGKISEMAEGLGQEYFNAGILLTAAIFIGWTVLWMKKHARHMKKHFEDIGHAVAEGNAPYIALSTIISLALLREGSEIVLFTYGMLATGQSPAHLAAGSIIGLTGGLVVGSLLYFGLIKLSVRVFFRVTSVLLIFLVAGMVSQALGFLVAAGHFEHLSRTMWDSSFLLTEEGMTGQTLATLIGYTARPTAIQFIGYIFTLIFLFSTMKAIEKNMTLTLFKKGVSTAAIIIAISGLAPSKAFATDNVTSPYVEKGELELEWKGGLTHDDDDDEQDGAWKQKASVGYGFTDRLQMEIEGEVEKEGDDGNTEFSALALEGKLQLTERGQYWADVGLKGEYEFNMLGDADKIEGKLLLAKDTGQFSHKANLSLEREVGEDSEDETEGGFAWSSRYRYNAAFEPGFELHSEFGDISNTGDFDEQGHKLGPVFYGKIGHIKYDVGYLAGISDSAPDGTFKAIIEYEIPLNAGK
jgi:high-affinity iron transporter